MQSKRIHRTYAAPANAGIRRMPQGVYRGSVRTEGIEPEALAQLYLSGKTLRQIGAEIGLCHAAVRLRLRKLKSYPAMVTKVLRMRTERAFLALTMARTRENVRKAKLAEYVFLRERPARFRQWLRRGLSRLSVVGEIRRIGVEYHAQADCPECGGQRSVEARGVPGTWCWSCSYCEAEA